MKKSSKKIALILSLALCLSIFIPAFSMTKLTSGNIEEQPNFIGGAATVIDVLENQIVVNIKHNHKEDEQKYVLNLSKDTYFVDNETGTASNLKDIKAGDKIYVYHSIISTMSIPPQTPTFVILTNIKENESIGKLIDVDNVFGRENGISVLNKKGDYIIHLTKETKVLPYLTKNIIHYSEIKNDDRLLIWFDIATASMPAQAAALKIVVLPSIGNEVDENLVKNITFAEFIRHIVVEIDGEKPVIMDTHYARPYMIKAKELGFISEAQYNDTELWNEKVKAKDIEKIFSIVKSKDHQFDFQKINSLIINKIIVNEIIIEKENTIVRNGVVMVPVRSVSEALGFKVTWEGTKSIVEISNDSIQTAVQIGYNNYFSKELESSPLLVEGKTYVPVEFYNLLFDSSEIIEISHNILKISK